MQRTYSVVVRLTIDGLPDTNDAIVARDKATQLIVDGLTTTADSPVRIENVVVDQIVTLS